MIERVSDGSVPLVNRMTAVPARSGVSVTLLPLTCVETTVESLDETPNGLRGTAALALLESEGLLP